MKYILSILLMAVTASVTAQNLPERGELRKGNDAFDKSNFGEASEHYSKSKSIAPELFEPRFNLANALMKSEKVEAADKMLAALAADSLRSDLDRSEAFYNLGNSQFAQQKLKEALESYKDAIRLNADDTEAKYNYSYVKTLLDQQQQNQDQNQDQQNQDQNQNKDQNQDQQQSGDDGENNQDQDEQQGDQGEDDQQQEQQQDQDQQNGQQDQDQGDEQEQPGDAQPQDGEISDQELQQMLDAIQAQEDKTQDDLKEKVRGVLVPGAKNW